MNTEFWEGLDDRGTVVRLAQERDSSHLQNTQSSLQRGNFSGSLALTLTTQNHLVKVKQYHYRPEKTLEVPGVWGSQITRQSAHEGGKVVIPTYRPSLNPRTYSWYSFLSEAEWTQGHSTAERIMSMKNSNDTIGNRSRDLPTACNPCSTEFKNKWGYTFTPPLALTVWKRTILKT
jgi:hypothetical protein